MTYIVQAIKDDKTILTLIEGTDQNGSEIKRALEKENYQEIRIGIVAGFLGDKNV